MAMNSAMAQGGGQVPPQGNYFDQYDAEAIGGSPPAQGEGGAPAQGNYLISTTKTPVAVPGEVPVTAGDPAGQVEEGDPFAGSRFFAQAESTNARRDGKAS